MKGTMKKDEKALRKKAPLAGRVQKAEHGGDEWDELRAAAFEALLLNPGSEEADWAFTLVSQYGGEVVDVYGGDDPPEVFARLADLWETPYLDGRSGVEYTFGEWAEAFATEQSVRMYYDITEKCMRTG